MTSNNTMVGRYVGERRAIFWLFFKTALLSLITIGIYRFWARTRVRRYVWSSAVPGDDAFEYTGKGLEKFLGFLVAVVVLAVYLGIFQVLLTVFGYNLFGTLFSDPQSEAQALAQVGATYIVLFALAPLILFAQYRARRYVASRTRWRGVRFAMDKGAWGYVWRGLLWGLLTLLTLGIMYPVMSYKLEKYMTDRMWYGSAKFEQGGKWSMLFGAFKHFYFAIILVVGVTVIGIATEAPILAIIGIIAFYIYLIFALAYYRAHSFNRLTNTKVLDGQVNFDASAKAGKVHGYYWAGIGMSLLVVLVVFGVLLLLGMSAGVMQQLGPIFEPGAANFVGGPSLFIIPVVLVYLVVIALIGALTMAFTSQPVLAHMIQSTLVRNASHLDTIKQRDGDDVADADGFADALDIGGAF